MNKCNDNIEILAPVGCSDHIEVALSEGVHSIYIGLKDYSARPKKYDFSVDDIIDIKKNTRNKLKLYAAINAPVEAYNEKGIISIIERLSKAKIDGLILSDWGLLDLIHSMKNDIPVHMSTLSGIHNVASVKEAIKLGATRIVLNTNLSYTEIKAIVSEYKGIEYEVIAAGGMCLFDCYRCRLQHFEDNNGFNTLCSLDFEGSNNASSVKMARENHHCINDPYQYANIGINCFKIEGRTKKPTIVRTLIQELKTRLGQPLNKNKHYKDMIASDELLFEIKNGRTNKNKHVKNNDRAKDVNFSDIINTDKLINNDTKIWFYPRSLEMVERIKNIKEWDGIIFREINNASFKTIMDLGIKMQWQTPMYLLGRNWSEILRTLDKVNELDCIEGIRIHDIGLLSVLKKNLNSTKKIIWDRFGWPGRVTLPLPLYERTLKNKGIDIFEYGIDDRFSGWSPLKYPWALFISDKPMKGPIPPKILKELKGYRMLTFRDNNRFIIDEDMLFENKITKADKKPVKIISCARELVFYTDNHNRAEDFISFYKNRINSE